MKKSLKIILTGLIGCVAIGAMANEVTIVNGSSDKKPLLIVYKIAHKNPGKDTVFGATQMIGVTSKAIIPINLDGYTLGGIVPVSINGHVLPPYVTEFGVPDKCSVATSEVRQSGQFTFILEKKKATCKVS